MSILPTAAKQEDEEESPFVVIPKPVHRTALWAKTGIWRRRRRRRRRRPPPCCLSAMLTLLLRGSRRLLTVNTVRAVNQSYYSQQMGKRVAVVLAGCGVYDGSEIHEASAILVHLSRGGASVSSIWPLRHTSATALG